MQTVYPRELEIKMPWHSATGGGKGGHLVNRGGTR